MIATTPVLTSAGKSLLLRAIAGEAITFTRFKAGSGNLPSGQSIEGLTDLIHTELAFPIMEVDDGQDGFIAITGGFSSDDVTQDFVWRELGIFAKGEDNLEILYAYSNDGANAGTVRALNTDVQTIQTVTMIVAIDEAENISVDYEPQATMQISDLPDAPTLSASTLLAVENNGVMGKTTYGELCGAEGPIKVATINVTTSGVQYNNRASIVAPSIAGYTFMCWIDASCTDGVHGYSIPYPLNRDTGIFASGESQINYVVTALYMHN